MPSVRGLSFLRRYLFVIFRRGGLSFSLQHDSQTGAASWQKDNFCFLGTAYVHSHPGCLFQSDASPDAKSMTCWWVTRTIGNSLYPEYSSNRFLKRWNYILWTESYKWIALQRSRLGKTWVQFTKYFSEVIICFSYLFTHIHLIAAVESYKIILYIIKNTRLSFNSRLSVDRSISISVSISIVFK